MRVALIGGGAMGGAFVEGFLRRGLLTPHEVQVYERSADQHARFRSAGIDQIYPGPGEALRAATHVILAVKPQDAREVCAQYAPFVQESHSILSVMAGLPSATLTPWLGRKHSVVRCMPNLPALVGEGMTVYYRAPHLSLEACAAIEQILSALGRVLPVSSEDAVDAATAVSGSGPGYFFYFAERLAHAAEGLGFSSDEALLLVKQTLFGTAQLWEERGGSAAEWRARVTSKGGTTEACLTSLESGKFEDLFSAAISAAFKRAQELAKQTL